MQCSICKSDNPDEKRYCGDCGAALDAQSERLRQQVSRAVNEQFKDRAIIEYEVTDRIITRLQSWAKIAAVMFAVVGGMLVIVVAILGFLGVKTYSDAVSKVERASDAAVANLQKQSSAKEENLRREAEKSLAALERYASPKELESAVRRAEQQARRADERVSAVVRSAVENEGKLNQIGSLQSLYPKTPIGDLNPGIFRPTVSGLTIPDITDLYKPSVSMESVLKDYSVGSKGADVEKIQRRLKELGCYDGEATGEFDSKTAVAVDAFKKAFRRSLGIGIPPLSTPTPEIASATTPGLLEGSVDYVTWVDLFSQLNPTPCTKQGQ
jgi:Tfp pilus assembly protein PilE